MRLTIAAVGRLKAGPERELAGRYLERAGKLGRGIGLHPIEVIEIDESRARRPEERIAHEAAALRALVRGEHVRVPQDAVGQTGSSEESASRLARWRDGGRS